MGQIRSRFSMDAGAAGRLLAQGEPWEYPIDENSPPEGDPRHCDLCRQRAGKIERERDNEVVLDDDPTRCRAQSVYGYICNKRTGHDAEGDGHYDSDHGYVWWPEEQT